MYKLGVMSTIVMLIFFLTLKGVFIGTMLLIMNVIFFAVKIASLKHSNYAPQQWQPPPPNYWPKQAADNSGGGVHVHIHNGEPVIHVAPITTPPPSYIEPSYGPYPASTYNAPEPYGSYLPSINNNNYKPFAKRSIK